MATLTITMANREAAVTLMPGNVRSSFSLVSTSNAHNVTLGCKSELIQQIP